MNHFTPNTDIEFSTDDLLSLALSDAAAGLGPKVKRNARGQLRLPNRVERARWISRNSK